MEPNNIEKLVKETFAERSIEPSPEARERLIEALNYKPKKKKGLWISYAIAASLILGLFFIGGKLLLENHTLEKPFEITFEKETPKAIEHEVTGSTHKNNSIVEEEQVDSAHNKVRQNQLQSSSSLRKIVTNNPVKKEDDVIENNQAVQVSVPIEKLEGQKLVKTEKIESLTLKESQKQIQYITAESLLISTVADSSLELIQNKNKLPSTYVESSELLLEIEIQLFNERNKNIFKKVDKQFKKIKEAVASRNYEN